MIVVRKDALSQFAFDQYVLRFHQRCRVRRGTSSSLRGSGIRSITMNFKISSRSPTKSTPRPPLLLRRTLELLSPSPRSLRLSLRLRRLNWREKGGMRHKARLEHKRARGSRRSEHERLAMTSGTTRAPVRRRGVSTIVSRISATVSREFLTRLSSRYRRLETQVPSCEEDKRTNQTTAKEHRCETCKSCRQTRPGYLVRGQFHPSLLLD